jgi:hypothetical protein
MRQVTDDNPYQAAPDGRVRQWSERRMGRPAMTSRFDVVIR